jgi:hypothetical protein
VRSFYGLNDDDEFRHGDFDIVVTDERIVGPDTDSGPIQIGP